MTFGFPDNIFRYPAVQYIPLRMKHAKVFDHSYVNRQTRLYVFKPEKQTSLYRILKQYNITNPDYRIMENQLAVLIINGNIKTIKYRKFEVILVGSMTTGRLHLFQITEKYFYENILIFNFYDQYTGNIITSTKKTMSE